jgi:hypothetical protein
MGDANKPIVYEVDCIRDGKSFTTRRVVAIQKGRAIFNMAASFQIDEPGFDHQDSAPTVVGLEGIASELELATMIADKIPESIRDKILCQKPIELRPVDPVNPFSPDKREPVRYMWFKAIDKMPDDPMGELGKMLGGGADELRQAGQTGSDMLGGLLGQSSATSLGDTLAGYVGGDRETVGTLLGLVGAGAMGSIKNVANENSLDASGVVQLLSSQKDEISAAIPDDLAGQLSNAGLLPANLKAPAAAAVVPDQSGGGMMKWVVGLVVVGLLLWLVPQFLGGSDPAPSEVSGDALSVDGVNLGDQFSELTTSLTDTLSGVTDGATAQSALEALTGSEAALGQLQTAVGGLNAEGQSAFAALAAAALPALQSTIQGLLGNSDIAAVLQPVLENILNSITNLAR